jgi:hypothetical protein
MYIYIVFLEEASFILGTEMGIMTVRGFPHSLQANTGTLHYVDTTSFSIISIGRTDTQCYVDWATDSTAR